jgi:hypothetical protein
VSWCGKKQPTVSRSNTEAEYRSLALTCTEILWLQYLLHEIQQCSQSIPTLWCDNIGATFLTANPMYARTKHIEIDYHFIRENVASNQLKVQFLCSNDQISFFTSLSSSAEQAQSVCDTLNLMGCIGQHIKLPQICHRRSTCN